MPSFKVTSTPKSIEMMAVEQKYAPHNYTPNPIICESALGSIITDVDGNEYVDFNDAYSACNAGHCHPDIVKAVKEQYDKIALPSRGFTHARYAEFCKTLCELFGFEKVLTVNGGAEAVEFAIKLSRSWGYVKKGIAPNKAKVMMAAKNFHGRTLGVTSGSTNETARKNYGPFIPNVGPYYGDGKLLEFNDVEGLEECFKLEGKEIAAFIVESVQGEAGIFTPTPGYLEKVRELCDKYNVLWVADEIQMGTYRCGPKRWAYENFSDVKPDVLITAKSISGGLYPVSVVLSSAEIMNTIEPNTHGSTFSGSPIACAATIAALKVYEDYKIPEHVAEVGPYMLDGLRALCDKYPLITGVRGCGLIAAFDLDGDLLEANGMTCWHVIMFLRAKGIAAKNLHHSPMIRYCPPLVITKEQIQIGLDALEDCCKELLLMKPEDIPGVKEFHYLSH
ncbi:hypothetical protein CANARDRAFT_9529 [[Candida] arabinofermentans NRRL YB-2248]|uniref:Ornithine aminotransferase n=1 Tax=[Candida] arabinofermentans NRRL YB-2248 TaxID=983967 RepID=A0A1E4SVD4_9ASCO|nr:hypothetical protein CANARDRAFT_9529 [[Candida] arabinofermentans NRRL YB-2248]